MNMTTNSVLFHVYIMNLVFRHIYHLAYQSELPKELISTLFNDLRSVFFEKLGILRNYQELKPKSHENISLYKILIPQNIDNVKLINIFI